VANPEVVSCTTMGTPEEKALDSVSVDTSAGS
jgi:hypothetical protein